MVDQITNRCKSFPQIDTPEFLKRVNDINGWFMESITEQSDENLIKLKEAVINQQTDVVGAMIIEFVCGYCSKSLGE